MLRIPVALSILAVGAAAFGTWQTGEPLKPGKLPKDVEAALRPGLTLRFYSGADTDKVLDVRRSRLAALHVPAGAPPSPMLPAGPFTARLTGYLKLSAKEMYSFQLAGTGTFTLSVNGKTVDFLTVGTDKNSIDVQLLRGYNRLEVTYTSPAKGDATLRVNWSSEGFATEPLPPDRLFSKGDDADLLAGQSLREGRQLFATLGCARCHVLPGGLTRAKCKMPELDQQAPLLLSVGQRLQHDWLARWIADPRSLRPDATMPRVLHGPGAAEQATDIAAYLGTLQKGKNSAAVGGDDKKGQKLFESLGCAACHHLTEPEKGDPLNLGRLSLFFVKAKFRPHQLQSFLAAPHQHYPWIRMPDFKLQAGEAADLAAFLEEQAKGTLDAAKKGDTEKGAKLFGSVGCASCHKAEADQPAIAFRPAPVSLVKGCLADGADGKTPDFALTKVQRHALRAFLTTDGSSLTRDTPAEFAQRQVKALQCNACHRRDGSLSKWDAVLEDEGTSPHILPSLSWIGEKLKPAWSGKLLAGQLDHRSRPWLMARMPAVPARAELLALGLSHEHGFAADEDHRPRPDPALAEIGKKLIVSKGGFNCVQCHAVGKQPALAPFEAAGINLLDAAQRLRYDYYPRWMLDPPHVDPTTRMVKLAPDGQTTALKEVLDGNARRQFDAIWHYMQTLPGKGGQP